MAASELKAVLKFKPWPKWIYLPLSVVCFLIGMEPRLWMIGRMEVIS